MVRNFSFQFVVLPIKITSKESISTSFSVIKSKLHSLWKLILIHVMKAITTSEFVGYFLFLHLYFIEFKRSRLLIIVSS